MTDTGFKPHTQANLDAFYEALKSEYETRFATDPDYAYSGRYTTPADLARKMTLGLDSGSANKNGAAVKAVCKRFRISHTYKAIRAFLGAQ